MNSFHDNLKTSSVKQKSVLCLSILLFSSLTSSLLAYHEPKVVYHDPEDFPQRQRSVGTTMAIGAAVGAAVAGVGACIASWFSETDDALCARTRNLLAQLYQEYCVDAVGAIEGGYSIDCSASDLENAVMRQLHPHVLGSLASTINAKTFSGYGTNYTGYCARLRSVRDELQKAHKELLKRYTKRPESRMLDLANRAEIIRAKLAFLHHYLKHHETYFSLEAVYRTYNARYAAELNCLPHHYYQIVLNQQGVLTYSFMGDGTFLKNIVYCNSNSRYPYFYYVDRINTDIQTLHRAINSVAYLYDNVEKARFLHNLLVEISSQVRVSGEYRADLERIERDRLEQERLQLERERIALERQRQQERLEYEARLAREARERAERERQLLLAAAARPTTVYVPVVYEQPVVVEKPIVVQETVYVDRPVPVTVIHEKEVEKPVYVYVHTSEQQSPCYANGGLEGVTSFSDPCLG
jgi:hypothetical protein